MGKVERAGSDLDPDADRWDRGRYMMYSDAESRTRGLLPGGCFRGFLFLVVLATVTVGSCDPGTTFGAIWILAFLVAGAVLGVFEIIRRRETRALCETPGWCFGDVGALVSGYRSRATSRDAPSPYREGMCDDDITYVFSGEVRMGRPPPGKRREHSLRALRSAPHGECDCAFGVLWEESGALHWRWAWQPMFILGKSAVAVVDVKHVLLWNPAWTLAEKREVELREGDLVTVFGRAVKQDPPPTAREEHEDGDYYVFGSTFDQPVVLVPIVTAQ